MTCDTTCSTSWLHLNDCPLLPFFSFTCALPDGLASAVCHDSGMFLGFSLAGGIACRLAGPLVLFGSRWRACRRRLWLRPDLQRAAFEQQLFGALNRQADHALRLIHTVVVVELEALF